MLIDFMISQVNILVTVCHCIAFDKTLEILILK